jgi:integrase
MRISEIAKLSWDKVNRDEWYIRLESTDTKNKHPRTIYLDDELKEVFQWQWDKRKAEGRLLPYVFTNRTGTDRIKRFDKAWKQACKDAKIGIRHFHDFRRSAIRNMVRAGLPEQVPSVHPVT